MSNIRKSYSPEEKAKIIMEILKGELTQAQIASKYAVHSTRINLWRKQFKEGVADIFRDKRRKDVNDKEQIIEELYKQIGQQKVEIEWLKKVNIIRLRKSESCALDFIDDL